MSFISLVSEFHKSFRYKQPEPTTPDLTCAATNKLRPKLLREELQETFDAAVKNDRVALLDGLCDLQYVLSGAVLAWGFRPLYVHLTPTVTLAKIRDEEAMFFAMFGLIERMEVAADNNYPMQVLGHLREFENGLRKMVWHYGFSPVFSDAFSEVHRSNMSKIWSRQDVKDWTERQSAFPLMDVQFEDTIGGYIARRDDGKIIKSPSYSPARLERFV